MVGLLILKISLSEIKGKIYRITVQYHSIEEGPIGQAVIQIMMYIGQAVIQIIMYIEQAVIQIIMYIGQAVIQIIMYVETSKLTLLVL